MPRIPRATLKEPVDNINVHISQRKYFSINSDESTLELLENLGKDDYMLIIEVCHGQIT